MNKQTITIGIPAYNEAQNIKKLILSVLKQNYLNVILDKIVVSSDGSNDDTVSSVKEINNSKIVVINNKDRKGIARGLNQIISRSNSDITVLLDADISIDNKDFIEKLIYPILKLNADLTSSAISEINCNTYFSKILQHSMEIKNILFSTFKNGKNIYTCHGLARAFSKKLYKSISFQTSIGNDMYSYLECISKGMKYVYSKDAVAFYLVPKNLRDHMKQSHRFDISSYEIKKYFNPEFVEDELSIPLSVYLWSLIHALPIILYRPILSLMYVSIQIYLNLVKKDSNVFKQAWDIAESSK